MISLAQSNHLPRYYQIMSYITYYISYDNKKYSVDPQYIGKTVSLNVSEDILHIYFNKSLIKTHKITQKKFNYSLDDYINILKSEAMKDAPYEDIEKIAMNNLAVYDKF